MLAVDILFFDQVDKSHPGHSLSPGRARFSGGCDDEDSHSRGGRSDG
jgi:hypothetical protein